MTPQEIEALPLAGATLLSIEVQWREASCRLTLRLGGAKRLLEFAGVSALAIRRTGPSPATPTVARLATRDGAVEVRMESGDVIEIAAAQVSFSAP